MVYVVCYFKYVQLVQWYECKVEVDKLELE